MQAIDLVGHQNPIYTVIAHPQKRLAYTAGNDKGIVEWNLEKASFSRLLNQVKHTVYSLEIITDLNLLVAGCNNGDICFFDLESTLLVFSINTSSSVFCLKYIAEKQEILASTDDGKILIIHLPQKKIVHQFQSGLQKIRNFDVSLKHQLLVTASNDCQVRMYSLDDYTFIQQFEAHSMGVSSIKFSPDNQTILTGSRDAHIKVWNISNLYLKQWAAHLFAVYQISFHPNLPYFASCSRDKSIKIWRTTDNSLFKNLSWEKNKTAHRLSVNQITWSYDGKILLSVGDDKLLKLWKFDEN